MRVVGHLHGKGHSGGADGKCWYCIDCMRPQSRKLTNAPWEGPYCHTGGHETRPGIVRGHYRFKDAATSNCRCSDKTQKEGPNGTT